LPAESFRVHAKYRAEAMLLRDASAATGGPGAEWDEIHRLLRESWRALWQAVQDS
jgi:hypothetical protein